MIGLCVAAEKTEHLYQPSPPPSLSAPINPKLLVPNKNLRQPTEQEIASARCKPKPWCILGIAKPSEAEIAEARCKPKPWCMLGIDKPAEAGEPKQ